jgi:hypothetical protein
MFVFQSFLKKLFYSTVGFKEHFWKLKEQRFNTHLHGWFKEELSCCSRGKRRPLLLLWLASLWINYDSLYHVVLFYFYFYSEKSSKQMLLNLYLITLFEKHVQCDSLLMKYRAQFNSLSLIFALLVILNIVVIYFGIHWYFLLNLCYES